MDRFDPYLAPHRGEPPEHYADDADAPDLFDADWVDGWINGLAAFEDGGATYLADDGIELADHADNIGELLQVLARAYRDKPEQFADLLGSAFFRAMKPLAGCAFANQN